MSITNSNLNLLKALDALLTERHVTQAGLKLGLTQSAMSLALKQLRQVIQDPLLVRASNGRMALTQRAEQLIRPTRLALQQAATILAPPEEFNPATTRHTFHIGLSDYLALVVLPSLLKTISHLAPHIQIVQHAVNYLDEIEIMDHLDMVIGDFPKAPGSLKSKTLFHDQGVVIADQHHPAFGTPVTMERLVVYPQVFVSLDRQPERNVIVEALRIQGYSLDIQLMTPHTLIALQVLPNTPFIAHGVARLAEPFLKSLGLTMQTSPYSIASLPDYCAKLYWHPRQHREPAHLWLRDTLSRLFD